MADLLPALREERPDVLIIDIHPGYTPALFAAARDAAPAAGL